MKVNETKEIMNKYKQQLQHHEALDNTAVHNAEINLLLDMHTKIDELYDLFTTLPLDGESIQLPFGDSISEEQLQNQVDTMPEPIFEGLRKGLDAMSPEMKKAFQARIDREKDMDEEPAPKKVKKAK